MSWKSRTVVWVMVLSVACGLVIWHAIDWYSSGMHAESYTWLQEGKGYLTVLYNLGLMLVLGVVLGILMGKVAALIGGYQQRKEGDSSRQPD